jgi:hypothetical protein
MFTQALAIAPHLSSRGLSGMVYEHLLRCFIPKDPSSGFSKLFQVAIIVAHGGIPRLMALVLGVSRLLAMVRDISGLHPIAISKMFLQLISHSIILQLWGPFQEHLSHHQFGVSTFGGSKAILLASKPSSTYTMIGDASRVENVFNNISWTIIF